MRGLGGAQRRAQAGADRPLLVRGKQRLRRQGRGVQRQTQGFAGQIQVMAQVVQARFDLVPAQQQIRAQGPTQPRGARRYCRAVERGRVLQFVQGRGCPGIDRVERRPWPEQALGADVPQLGVGQAVTGHLPVGRIPAIEQDVDVQQVQRLTKMYRAACRQWVGHGRDVVALWRTGKQRRQAPEPGWVYGIEHVAYPRFGLGVLLLLVQALCQQPGQVKKQLPVIGAMGAVKVQGTGLFLAWQGRLAPGIRRQRKQLMQTCARGFCQQPGHAGVGAYGRSFVFRLIERLDSGPVEVDELCRAIGRGSESPDKRSQWNDGGAVIGRQGESRGFQRVAQDDGVGVMHIAFQ